MRYLVATDSVHTTAAACDYLDAHADPDDAVTVLTVGEGDDRDGMDALNVASARLAGMTVETERRQREGTPAEEILAAADGAGADVPVVGARGGRPGASGAGTTARRVVAAAEVPVVVVPLPDLD